MSLKNFFLSLFPLAVGLSLQGQCVIWVQLADEELVGDEEGVDYFLLFAGSTQRHLTSTLRSSHDTLQAVCPGKPYPLTMPCAVFVTSNGPEGRLLHLQHLIQAKSVFNLCLPLCLCYGQSLYLDYSEVLCMQLYSPICLK